MKPGNTNDKVFLLVLLIPIVWLGLLIAPYIDHGIMGVITNFSYVMDHPFQIRIVDNTLKSLFLCLVVYLICCGVYLSTRMNKRPKEEYGSASWADVKQVNKKYANKTFSNNKLFTRGVRMGLDVRRFQRNLNSLIIGGSGAGKTRFYAKPNLMQCNTSFVVLDPKGGAIRSRIKSTCAQLNI